VLIESSFAQEQAVELIVPLTDHVAHLHRSDPATEWSPRGSGVVYPLPSPPPSGDSAPLPMVATAVTCIQANYGLPANLEAVVAVGATADQPATSLVPLYFDANTGTWNSAGQIAPEGVDITSITADPVMFQSKIGRQGDFELLVPEGGVIWHLFRDNDNGMVWKKRAGGVMYGGGGGLSKMISQSPDAVAAWQSTCGTAGTPDFHAIVRVPPAVVESSSGDVLDARRFDPAAGHWVDAGTVAVDGKDVTVLTTEN
jgi:hypothetical protein